MTGEESRPVGPGRGPRRGDLIGGHRIERPLGAGAMGTVWLAEHVTLGRRVALKILAHGLADDPAFQDRFMREARLAARLDHPNVVAVHDAGTDPAGLWLSMRYVEGEDLRRRLDRVAGPADGAAADSGRAGTGPGSSGPPTRSTSPFKRPVPAEDERTVALRRGGATRGGLPPDEAVRIVEAVAAGLDHAHSRGILHRDVKPGNVLLEADGDAPPTPAPPADGAGSPEAVLPPFRRVLLADFGLTKELEDAGGDLTQTGMLLGSADSVAPEQIEGREVDARVDVYALGSLLYVALTGAPPFAGATMAKLFAHVNAERPRVSALLPQLAAFDAVIAAGMAKDPEERPATAGELAALAREAVGRLDVDPQATVAFPAPTPPRDRRPPPRPRPVPPSPGAPLAPRMREEPTPTEPRTRVAPIPAPSAGGPSKGARPAAPVGSPSLRPPAPARAASPPPPQDPPDDRSPNGSSRPWLVPVLVVGGLVVALVVVLALGLGGGSDPAPRADSTTSRTTADAGDEPSGASTAADPPAADPADTASTGASTPDPPASTAAEAPPAQEEVSVRGGGTIAAGAATRDPGAGSPLAGTGTPADYVAPDGSWRTLLARPDDGWAAPTRVERGSALDRVRQEGPGGRLLLVDHTPSQAASFETSGALETRTITGTAFGDVQGYRFKDARIGSIPECTRLQCVDVPLNKTSTGPGWGVLVAAPTAAEAWATVERVVRATGP